MEEERISQLITIPEWKTILLELVEKNEIDPWNVDIVRLTSLYLEEIKRRRDLDLYLPANAVLASSILLWLKSKILREVKEELEPKEDTEQIPEIIDPLPEVEELPDVVIPEDVSPQTVLPPSRIVRRTVSLDELLEVMERIMKKGVRRVARPVLPEVEEFFEEMEEEDVEDYVEEVLGEIKRLSDSTGMVLLSKLASSDPLNFVKTFLAVLYLANQGKTELYQERAFGDVIIKTLS